MIWMETLSNGIRVVGEPIGHVRSVALGVWILAGSVRETAEEAGISHFIEHMLFKGTERRSAKQIAAEMDGIGAQINAFTAKECTCYHIKAMDEHLEKAVDMLGDIVLCSTFDEAEIEKEKGVVVEEILMMEDSPEDISHELLAATYFDRHNLGCPILGQKETVQAFSRKDLTRYIEKQYTPGQMVIAIAGNFEKERLLALLEQHFASHRGERGTQAYQGAFVPETRRFAAREKDVEQIHIALGLPGFPMEDERLYPLLVFNNFFGGSMSSRLFQKIREEKGLAYSVYSYPSPYRQTGIFVLYAGTGAQTAEQVFSLLLEETRGVKDAGFTEEEFSRSKEQLKGNYILGQESTSARMSAIGKGLLLRERVYTEEEILQRIERVTRENVLDMLPELLDESRMSVALVGRMDGQKERIEGLLGNGGTASGGQRE